MCTLCKDRRNDSSAALEQLGVVLEARVAPISDSVIGGMLASKCAITQANRTYILNGSLLSGVNYLYHFLSLQINSYFQLMVVLGLSRQINLNPYFWMYVIKSELIDVNISGTDISLLVLKVRLYVHSFMENPHYFYQTGIDFSMETIYLPT